MEQSKYILSESVLKAIEPRKFERLFYNDGCYYHIFKRQLDGSERRAWSRNI